MADLYPLMHLYSNPSENKLDEDSKPQFTAAETGATFLERHQLLHICHPVL